MAPIEASRTKDHFCSFEEAENGRCPMGKGFVDLTIEEGVENEVEVMTGGEVGSGSLGSEQKAASHYCRCSVRRRVVS